MRVLVFGSSGCIGSAVVRALRWRGHRVVETRHASRATEADVLALDLAGRSGADQWATQLAALDIDAIVNCAGTALPGPPSTGADRLHGDGPIALFRGAERARVARVVNVSALDAKGRDGARCRPGHRFTNGRRGGETPGRREDGWRTKHLADDVLLSLDLDAVVVRPSLVCGPGSRSAEALAALACAPIEVMPDGGGALLQPIHVFELAESVAALVERTGAARGVYELGGADVVSYGDLLAALRVAQGAAAPLRLPMPMALARFAARLASSPRLVSSDVLRLLDHVGVTRRNAAPVLLGRPASTLAEALLVTPPTRLPSPNPKRLRGARWLHQSRGVL